MRTRRFSAGYREPFALADGTQAELRPVTAADAALLRAGFDQLSSQSRYFRFCGPKVELSDEEVRYLTDIDGESHFALGAVLPQAGQGIAVARFVRLPGDPRCAEAALAVVDRYQGHGLGRHLLARLVEAARERGVERFEVEVVPGNDRMLALLRRLAQEPPAPQDGSISFSVPLASASTPASLLWHLLALAAQGGFRLLSAAHLVAPERRGEGEESHPAI